MAKPYLIALIVAIAIIGNQCFASQESNVANDNKAVTDVSELFHGGEFAERGSTGTWTSVVSGNTVAVSSTLSMFTKEMPIKQKNALLEKSLLQVQKMREDVEPYGVILEGFSLNLGMPLSITVNFKFKDKK